jgi:hypothetical protein
VDEVASLPVEAIPDVSESKARAGFVGMIIGHVVSELISSVGKLALRTVGAIALIHIISAEGPLYFGGTVIFVISLICFKMIITGHQLCLLTLSGDI